MGEVRFTDGRDRLLAVLDALRADVLEGKLRAFAYGGVLVTGEIVIGRTAADGVNSGLMLAAAQLSVAAIADAMLDGSCLLHGEDCPESGH